MFKDGKRRVLLPEDKIMKALFCITIILCLFTVNVNGQKTDIIVDF